MQFACTVTDSGFCVQVVFTPLHELVTGSERVDECLALDVIPKSALLPSALGGEVRRTDDGYANENDEHRPRRQFDSFFVNPTFLAYLSRHMTYFRGPNNPPGCRQVCVQFKVGCAPVPASPPQYSIDASLSKFSAALARERKQRAASTVQQQALTLTDLLRNLDLPEKLVRVCMFPIGQQRCACSIFVFRHDSTTSTSVVFVAICRTATTCGIAIVAKSTRRQPSACLCQCYQKCWYFT